MTQSSTPKIPNSSNVNLLTDVCSCCQKQRKLNRFGLCKHCEISLDEEG